MDGVGAAFEEDGVVPGAVPLGDAFADADGAVLGEEGGLQGPQAGLVSGGDLLADEGFPDAAAAVAVSDVDGAFGDADALLDSLGLVPT